MGIKEKLRILETEKITRCSEVNDDYSCGFYNGIEFCLSVLSDTKPEYMVAVSEHVEVAQETEQSRTGIRGKRVLGG